MHVYIHICLGNKRDSIKLKGWAEEAQEIKSLFFYINSPRDRGMAHRTDSRMVGKQKQKPGAV